jgi:dsRNA-specific ribonuclease/predicted protein tyrosine phosphatase
MKGILKNYFEKRNKTLPEFIRNRNYETSYLTVKAKEANEVVKFIINYNADNDITYVEVGAGIGIITSAMLDNKNVKNSLVYEFDQGARQMLGNNLNSYKFTNYELVNEDSFSGIPGEIYALRTRVVVLVNFTGGLEKFISRDRLNLMIEDNFKASLFVILNLPDDYTFTKPESIYFNKEKIGENLVMTYVVPKKTREPVMAKRLKKEDLLLIDDSLKFKIDVDIPKEFYKPNVLLPAKYTQKTQDWRNKLKHFLQNLLRKTGLPPSKISQLLDEESMQLFESAFTDSTVDSEQNYEVLETVGDFVLTSAFSYYVTEIDPNLPPQRITELKKKVLSTDIQSIIAVALGFQDYIVSRIPITRSVFEDVLEAFFGALVKSGNRKFKHLGYTLCLNMVNDFMTEMLEVDFYHSQKDAPTEVQQIFRKLHWDDPIITTSQNQDRTITVTVKLTGKGAKYIYDKSNFQPRPTLGIGTANTKKEANQIAFRNALGELKRLGIDDDYAEKVKMDRLFKNPVYKDLYEQVRRKILKMGYKDFVLRDKNTKSAKILLIEGVSTDGTKKILFDNLDFSKSIMKQDFDIESMKKFLDEV